MFFERLMLTKTRVPIAALALIIVGGALSPLPNGGALRHAVWMAGLVVIATPMLWRTLRGMMKGKFAADLVAALAVIGSIAMNQPIVGLVIVLMQTGGEALEKLAEGRATDALSALESAAPKTVHRIRGESIEEVDVDQVSVGDSVLVRPGEMVPCDGSVISGSSHLDTAGITGEPLPRKVEPEGSVMSGSLNQESPLVVRVAAVASESQYGRIVALVREAQSSKAPLQRVADRYAVLFTPFTLAMCAAAFIVSHDWERVLAVLAIATPCPLILAAPVAILGGFNRAARRQILVRNGGALEALGAVTAIVFDKTGTLTIGRPEVSKVVATGSRSSLEVLRVASGVEQGSGHLLARMLILDAESKGLRVPVAMSVVETAGRGVEGDVESLHVTVGARSFVDERNPEASAAIDSADEAVSENAATALRAYVAIDGVMAGFVEYADKLRPRIRELVERLRDAGVLRVVLLSGDRGPNVAAIAASVGITEFRGDMLPENKVEVVKELMDDGEAVAMIGDGTNDAPALGAATVGIAIASHGRGIATEAADVILLADDPSRIIDAIEISRRTMRIARQSIWAGLGISAAGMTAALLGHVSPVAGAGIQELVDLAVILNALRASRDNTYGKRRRNLIPLPTEHVVQAA